MSYGMLVEGEGGRLLIDPDYSNYTIVENGSITTSHVGGDVYSRTLGVSSSYTNPVILYRQPTGSAVSYWGRTLYSFGTSSVTVSYAIAVPVSTVSASSDSYGMRVWDSSGRRVFDSGHPIINTISTYSYSGTGEPTVSANTNDWLMATTWGIVRFVNTTAGGNLSFGLCIFLEKQSGGNLRARTLPNGMTGPGHLQGQRIANNSIYVNRCRVA